MKRIVTLAYGAVVYVFFRGTLQYAIRVVANL
jgi:hypothetical protein